jgi:replicative DNA helicase
MNHDTDELDTPTPSGVDAEQYVLGAMMLSREAILDVLELGLQADHFRRPAHQEVFAALADVFARTDAPIDPVVVSDELAVRDTLQRVGGAPYLHTLFALPVVPANAAYYASIVLRSYKLRLVGATGIQLQQYAESGKHGADADEMLDRARASLEQAAGIGRVTDNREFDQVVDDWLASLSEPKVPPLSTGIQDLDELLGGGTRSGQFVVVGARPGIGKSVIGTNFAVAAAKKGFGAAICSLEMSEGELLERIFADQAGVALERIRQPKLLGQDDMERLGDAADRISALPLKIVDAAQQTLATIRAVARDRARTARGLRLLVVDYLQLMSGSGRANSRQEEISEISRGLKLLAKELGITVVALSQLNRGSEQRAGGRPQLSDLRESGSIEQDADIVLLLHRDQDDETAADSIEVRVQKHRGGRTGVLDLFWVGPYQRVTSRSPYLRAV